MCKTGQCSDVWYAVVSESDIHARRRLVELPRGHSVNSKTTCVYVYGLYRLPQDSSWRDCAGPVAMGRARKLKRSRKQKVSKEYLSFTVIF